MKLTAWKNSSNGTIAMMIARVRPVDKSDIVEKFVRAVAERQNSP